jgi:hypothetical protein
MKEQFLFMHELQDFSQKYQFFMEECVLPLRNFQPNRLFPHLEAQLSLKHYLHPQKFI